MRLSSARLSVLVLLSGLVDLRFRFGVAARCISKPTSNKHPADNFALCLPVAVVINIQSEGNSVALSTPLSK